MQNIDGTLQPGESYQSALATRLPPAIPGDYHVIVRADIFNQLYEDLGDANNAVASDDTLAMRVDEIQLGVPFPPRSVRTSPGCCN